MVAPNSFLFFVLFFLCMQICFYEMYVLCATCTGNDTSIQTTLPPNTNATSPWSVDSRTEVQTEKTMTSTFSSQYENGMTSHTSKTVSITTAPVSFSHTGQSIITSSKLTTPKSYTDTTLNSTSSPAAKITGSTDGSGLSSHNTSVGVSVLANTANSNISLSEGTPTPSQTPDSGLTLLAFGVMSLILILIVVMVVLVTAINLRGRCRDTIQHEGIKSCDSVVSDRYRFSPDVFSSQHYTGQ
ncbi:endothelial cell-specific chemotaxis regulator-like isoform X3 [Sinocyclocheilus rhinocerous]|uniref:endothelial cell-specific chemotaxis regulator-like isoform X3 n=1 Tax=Sinocyclocheilus rhinocerous TaxID=307959 RepID=UPI0007BA4A29|nr:PREDICTED: endothelial cell-specific chemotaxis regulator-like isoform X3 [Sinocyclocheilus rhinocerous]